MRLRVAIAAGCLLLAGCVTEQDVVQGQQSMLSAAGFSVVLANTPERQHELATLPPFRFAFQERDGKTVYVYPDPKYCKCLFIGDEMAYQRYWQWAIRAQIAQQQLTAAQLNWNAWSWGPWGPWGPGW